MDENKNTQQNPEVPVFIIQREKTPQKKHWQTLLRRLALAVGILALALLAFFAYQWWRNHQDGDLPISVTEQENITKLQNPPVNEKAQVVMTTDSILDVPLEFYAIHGVRANIEFAEPDTLDQSVFLYCRSADHRADSIYRGALVVNGEEKPSDDGRMGYMAMAGDRFVIGISGADETEMKDYVIGQGGSYFRQQVLVSANRVPHDFELHGKVERKAIGRIGEQYYLISTLDKETMWDFADALREYGFIDAVYITGGNDYCYYRDSIGTRHDIGDVSDYPHKKWAGIAPWLVFRKR